MAHHGAVISSSGTQKSCNAILDIPVKLEGLSWHFIETIFVKENITD